MKRYFCLYFILLVMYLIPVYAQVTREQKRLLLPHLDKITHSLPVLEGDLQVLKQEYQESLKQYQALREKSERDNSLLNDAWLKTKLTYYSHSIAKDEEKIKEKSLQIAIYYCILDAFEIRTLSRKDEKLARDFIPAMQGRLQWAENERQKALNRKHKAERRLGTIPQDEQKTREQLARLKSKLNALEYKKTWSNLPERTALISKIGFHNSVLLELKAERLVQDKIISDAEEEVRSYTIEIYESQVALSRLDS